MLKFTLSKKLAIVTGSTAGIGKAIAKEFALAGANVIVCGRNAERGRTTVNEIKENAGSADFIPVDIADETSIRALFEETRDRHGILDVLVNNAGQSQITHFLDTSGSDLMAACAVNLQGPFVCSREAIRQMRAANKPGVIVNISSIGGLMPAMYDVNQYCASKGGLESLTKTLAFEFASYGIRVNGIAPGFVETDMVSSAVQGPIKPRGPIFDPARLLLGRRGKPEDIAAAALFFASEASSYVTGQTLLVDGGFSIG